MIARRAALSCRGNRSHHLCIVIEIPNIRSRSSSTSSSPGGAWRPGYFTSAQSRSLLALGIHRNVNEGVLDSNSCSRGGPDSLGGPEPQQTLRALHSRSACNVGAEGSKVRPFPLTVCGSRSSGNGVGEQNPPRASVEAIVRCTHNAMTIAKRS